MTGKESAASTALPINSFFPDRTTLAAFLALVLISGGASVAIRLTYAELPPFWGGALRFTCGGLFFWCWALIGKIPIPRGKALVGVILFGILGIGLSFALLYWGLVKTPASLFQTILAMVPLLTLFFTFFHGLEPFRSRGLIGAILTVAGMAITMGGSRGANLSFAHILAIICGAACLAEAGIVVKLFPRSHPVATNAVAMTVGASILTLASFLVGESPVIPTTATTWIAFSYIVVFVTIVSFILFLFVLNRWTASGTSYQFVLIPLVTVLVARLLADEQITWQFILGSALVIFGVWIGALLPSKGSSHG